MRDRNCAIAFTNRIGIESNLLYYRLYWSSEMTVFSVILIALLAVAVFYAIKVRKGFAKNLNWFKAYENAIEQAGAKEKQVRLPNGNVINYGEVENEKPALLLIHGQMGSWEDYAPLLGRLKENWHVYAIDVYGHGKSSHDSRYYYIDRNADDLIWFIDNVIGQKTVVAGHSNGALTTAYIGAYGSDNVRAVVLEDPPVFSTEGENWEGNFAYLDTYKPLHDWNHSDKSVCWEEYYLRNCYWGKLFLKDKQSKLADYAHKYHEKHPDTYVKIPFVPYPVWGIFHFFMKYDPEYGEHFYDLTWCNGHSQKDILSSIKCPCIYIHAKESQAPTGVYTCAATREQAERAVGYIGNGCELLETQDSEHNIHITHSDFYIEAINRFSL